MIPYLVLLMLQAPRLDPPAAAVWVDRGVTLASQAIRLEECWGARLGRTSIGFWGLRFRRGGGAVLGFQDRLSTTMELWLRHLSASDSDHVGGAKYSLSLDGVMLHCESRPGTHGLNWDRFSIDLQPAEDRRQGRHTIRIRIPDGASTAYRLDAIVVATQMSRVRAVAPAQIGSLARQEAVPAHPHASWLEHLTAAGDRARAVAGPWIVWRTGSATSRDRRHWMLRALLRAARCAPAPGSSLVARGVIVEESDVGYEPRWLGPALIEYGAARVHALRILAPDLLSESRAALEAELQAWQPPRTLAEAVWAVRARALWNQGRPGADLASISRYARLANGLVTLGRAAADTTVAKGQPCLGLRLETEGPELRVEVTALGDLPAALTAPLVIPLDRAPAQPLELSSCTVAGAVLAGWTLYLPAKPGKQPIRAVLRLGR